jgi:two-component system, NarL family, response regulator
MNINDDAPRTHDARQTHPVEIEVAIIEDETRIREGLATLIDLADGFRCASQFASMEEALEKIGDDLPDIALVDIGLPGITKLAC